MAAAASVPRLPRWCGHGWRPPGKAERDAATSLTVRTAFVGDHGSAYARFDVPWIVATRRLRCRPQPSSGSSLFPMRSNCLVLRADSRRYDKAIIRWTARYVSEYRVSLDEGRRSSRSLLALGRSRTP